MWAEVKRRLFRPISISNQARKQVHHEIHWTPMSRVFNLRDVFQLVVDCFYQGSLPKQNLIDKRHQNVFHVASKVRYQLHAAIPELLKEFGGDVTLVAEKLSVQIAANSETGWRSSTLPGVN